MQIKEESLDGNSWELFGIGKTSLPSDLYESNKAIMNLGGGDGFSLNGGWSQEKDIFIQLINYEDTWEEYL